jgi:hypothetical protein
MTSVLQDNRAIAVREITQMMLNTKQDMSLIICHNNERMLIPNGANYLLISLKL